MLSVRDVMTRDVVTAGPSTSLKEVARLLVEHRVSGLPVVDDGESVIGVISEGDLLFKEQDPDALERRPLAGILGDSDETRARLAKMTASTAGEAMTAPAVTIGPDASISEAAATMSRRAVNRLPVVEGSRLIGVVSRADVVRAFVRSDEDIAEAIREDVLRRALWLDPAGFDLSVADGAVRIGGRVGRRSTAEMAARVVGLVPGVVRVDSDIAWELDDRDIQAPERDLVSPYTKP